uniref:(northern house mosquito) hypothetical protein n=1 Tax=Culex pipiens TaxID=7175 RepID=A0A8D8DSX2_CULPI
MSVGDPLACLTVSPSPRSASPNESIEGRRSRCFPPPPGRLGLARDDTADGGWTSPMGTDCRRRRGGGGGLVSRSSLVAGRNGGGKFVSSIERLMLIEGCEQCCFIMRNCFCFSRIRAW